MNSLKSKLLLVGVISVLITLSLVGLNFFGIQQGNLALSNVYEHQIVPATALQEIDRDLKEVRFRMAGVLLDVMPAVGSRNHLQEVKKNVPEQWRIFKSTSNLGNFSDEASKDIAGVEKKMPQFTAFLERLSEAYRKEDRDAISDMLEDEWPLMYMALVKPISRLLPEQQAAVKITYAKSYRHGNRMLLIGGAVSIFAIFIIAISVFTTFRTINRDARVLTDALAGIADGNLGLEVGNPRLSEFSAMAVSLRNMLIYLQDIVSGVKSTATHTAESAERLLQQVNNMLQRDDERNARILQVSSAAEELNASISEVADVSSRTADAVGNNEQFAMDGNTNMVKNSEITAKVLSAVTNSSESIDRLDTSIQQIGQITTVIDDIAEQTNLLALNAAIEAARAGEQGRGFAVVADEVRQLAKRTATSTKEISSVVELVRRDMDSAVKAMDSVQQETEQSSNYNELTATALKQIVSSAHDVSQLVSHIVGSTGQQSMATGEVAANMAEIANISQDNFDSLQQMRGAADELSSLAAGLQKLTEVFRL
jgi:methyl-accepting chemotaxis protein